MKQLLTICLCIVILTLFGACEKKFNSQISNQSGSGVSLSKTDSLPAIFPENHADIVASRLRHEARMRFMQFDLPETKDEWEVFKAQLREKIIDKTGIFVDHSLPLDIHETGSIQMQGYTVKNIFFQTLPGLYATANLYVPDGEGPFPAVIKMHGHLAEAKMATAVQSVAHSLAKQGYVCLCIDAFGGGERGTIHGEFEYHGTNLGASLMNIGQSLLGIQVSENMRGIDLLCSLPYVDAENIGATGASGGGNQTMWVTAMDDRVKAASPVVSVGTFESYIMGSNCVCELEIDGLTLSEESGILAMVAPRAILIQNHTLDSNAAFLPSEMMRTYTNVKPVFEMLGAGDHLRYQLFDLIHGYAKEDREAMLGWFNFHLKKTADGSPIKENKFETLVTEQLIVFAPGERNPGVASIQEYCQRQGSKLKNELLAQTKINIDLKRRELKDILRIDSLSVIKRVHSYSPKGGWDRFALETADGKLIPLLHLEPTDNALGYTMLFQPNGKEHTSLELIDDLKRQGSGIVIVDLFGTGEASSPSANVFDRGILGPFHTLARAELWLGRTVMGEWVNEIYLVEKFLEENFSPKIVNLDASRESGLAALFYAALYGVEPGHIILRESPVSYLFDTREGLQFFSMAIHLPGILSWGDVSLAAAIASKEIEFIDPVTVSGNPVFGDQLKDVESEFDGLKMRYGCQGSIKFSPGRDPVVK